MRKLFAFLKAWFRAEPVEGPRGVTGVSPARAEAATWRDVPRGAMGEADLVWMYERQQIRHEWVPSVVAMAARIRLGRDRYVRVQELTGVPWMVVGVIHALEGNCNFGTHLHNGDPLTAKTVRVPAGRPAAGSPPFGWVESAVDAVTMKGWTHRSWPVGVTLDRLEQYNGLGYRKYHPDVATPYLWSGTTFYERGKYVRDGVWDARAVSKQVGAAPLLQALNFLGMGRVG